MPSCKQDRLSVLAFLLVGHGIRQTRAHLNRFRLACRNIALALVEEGRALQPRLQRHRRVVGRWPPIGALDPGLTRHPVIFIDRLISTRLLARMVTPGERRGGDDRRLVFMNGRLVLGRGDRLGVRYRLIIDPSFFVTPTAAPRD